MSASAQPSILVVDDNDVNRMLVRRQLERLGVRAACVETGAEALAAFTSEEYSLVLLDCRLPLVDGFEIARRMRRWEGDQASGRRTPIVALTASTEPQLGDQCSQAGMDGLLHKPASLDDIRSLLPRYGVHADRSADYPVDVSVLQRLLTEIESPGVVRALLETYLQQLPLRAAGLRAALSRGDLNQVTNLAHELRAAGDSVGAVLVGRLCQQLERAATTGVVDPDVELPRVAEACSLTATAVRGLLATDLRDCRTTETGA